MSITYSSQDEARLAFLRQVANEREITEDEFKEAIALARKMRGSAIGMSATSRLAKSAQSMAARTPSAKVAAKTAASAAADSLFKDL